MNKYELALVLNARVEDEVRLAALEKAKGYITRYNGVISEVEEWGKKRLAYDIQKMHEGYYYFIQFEAEPTCPVELENHMHIMDNVLRYLIINRTDEPAAEQAKEAAAGEPAQEEEAPVQE